MISAANGLLSQQRHAHFLPFILQLNNLDMTTSNSLSRSGLGLPCNKYNLAKSKE